MSAVGRQDRVLPAGFAAAVFVAFFEPLRALLTPKIVFLFLQRGKRIEARARVVTAEAEALQTHARAAGMGWRLATFAQVLGRSIDVEVIRDVVVQHLLRLLAKAEGRNCVRLSIETAAA